MRFPSQVFKRIGADIYIRRAYIRYQAFVRALCSPFDCTLTDPLPHAGLPPQVRRILLRTSAKCSCCCTTMLTQSFLTGWFRRPVPRPRFRHAHRRVHHHDRRSPRHHGCSRALCCTSHRSQPCTAGLTSLASTDRRPHRVPRRCLRLLRRPSRRNGYVLLPPCPPFPPLTPPPFHAGYFVFKIVRIYAQSDRYKSARITLTIFGVIALAMLLATFVMMGLCMLNFGKGLREKSAFSIFFFSPLPFAFAPCCVSLHQLTANVLLSHSPRLRLQRWQIPLLPFLAISSPFAPQHYRQQRRGRRRCWWSRWRRWNWRGKASGCGAEREQLRLWSGEEGDEDVD